MKLLLRGFPERGLSTVSPRNFALNSFVSPYINVFYCLFCWFLLLFFVVVVVLIPDRCLKIRRKKEKSFREGT